MKLDRINTCLIIIIIYVVQCHTLLTVNFNKQLIKIKTGAHPGNTFYEMVAC